MALNVLIVDDHMDTRALCSAVVLNLGHAAEAVPSVAAAMRAAEQRDFDLLVCDIMLPDGTGYELMRELGRRKHVRGIALTGCHTPADVERSRAAGFVSHIAKPFDLSVLEQAIRKVEANLPPAVHAVAG